MFENEVERNFYLSVSMLEDVLNSNNVLKEGEFIHEIQDIKIIR